MNKQKVIRFLGILLMVFGVTFLDYDQPAFSENAKAYIALILGAVIVLIISFNSYKKKEKPKF
ncbi:hypothetical protein LRR18_03290 [Mangrovimonas sp. AS39]|uniref:hypothetical protein n=2 Tax=Flavobacteriaceae TaxID=49546 RepID=UPI001E46B4E9|nr:hypothetical protein [Mangrovimonas futianensis]MCF1190596.1 hypothetical protein [Mangrovimonas futianensis]MCF1193652.1 hypothetical protein [Mangrovimonas futianensis]